MRRLKYMPYANARVIVDDNTILLVSYTTTVCVIKDGWLRCHGLYSATTRKHISAFASEYTNLSYSDIKRAYEGDYSINIVTKEISKQREFTVTIEELVAGTFTVTADTADAAIEKAREQYKAGKIVLEPGEVLDRQMFCTDPETGETKYEKF